MSEWKTLTLGDLCTKITGGSHQSPKTVLNCGFPMSSVKDLYHYGIDLDSSRTISENDYQALVKQGCKPEVGDVLIAKDGNSALDTVCVINEPIETVLLSSVAILRPNPLEIVPEYLKYYLTAPKTIEYLKSNFISGAAIPRVVLRDFKLANITYPPLSEQKAIAHILGKLDDKIELNRQMNQTHEAMAQALFKSWFVDFDPVLDNMPTGQAGALPDELKTKYEKRTAAPTEQKLISTNPALAALFPSSFVFNETLGKWIPEGWEVKSLGKLIKLIGGGTPKTSIEEYWKGNVPWFSVVDAPNNSDVFVIDTEKKVSNEGVKNSSTQILREGTTIISARGTVGKCAKDGVPMAMNQSCYGIQNLNENEDIFTYLLVSGRGSFINSYLFSRIPQTFAAHRIELTALSILPFADFFEVTVNFKYSAKLQIVN